MVLMLKLPRVKYPGDTGEKNLSREMEGKELEVRAIVSLGLSWAT